MERLIETNSLLIPFVSDDGFIDKKLQKNSYLEKILMIFIKHFWFHKVKNQMQKGKNLRIKYMKKL